MPENERVRVEMETFLRALATYPDRFAANPGLSFDEYRRSLVASISTSPAENAPVRAKAKASGI
jgi:hypothetical protein